MKKTEKKEVRLSPDVVPSKYEITLKPDLEEFVFDGEETIHLSIKKPTKTITLHSIEIDIVSVEMVLKSGSNRAMRITYDTKAETATLHFRDTLPRGEYRLHIVFRGTLNDRMHGFYRSSYLIGTKKHYMAATQFEATDARRAFPCFDEPAQKAVFEVSLTVPKAKTAISNTLPVATKTHADGAKTVRFSPTPLMSTYLLAFIVGDFEHVKRKSPDGVLVRVFTTPGKKHQATFALDSALKTLAFFNSYFAIPYPLPVLDMIAIPDFSAGAMENWGAITYRESALLVDPKQSSTANKQWVALVIAHEIAHQWFGNLVTMSWWTDLWLNEGFAAYIEYLAVDHVYPQWDIWTQFLHADLDTALHADGLKHTHPIEVEVHHPAEITEVFDAVSYNKGASIIRMLADYLGEKIFREGLRYYLKKHRYGNTSTKDLWKALAHVSGKPVAKIMNNWTSKPGYPLLEVADKGKSYELRQSRFFASPLSQKQTRDATVWHIPIRQVSSHSKRLEPFLMSVKTARSSKNKDAWIKFNAEESGFYRTSYPGHLRTLLAEAASEKKLNTRDRLGLIRDVFALTETALYTSVDALAFASAYTRETEYVVWAEVISGLGKIRSLIVQEPFLEAYDSFARSMLADVGGRMQWNTKPKSHSEALLKVLILESLARYRDASTISHANKLFAGVSKNQNSIPADLRGVAYNTAARSGGEREYKKLTELYNASPLHEEKNRIGRALGNFKQKALLKHTLGFAISSHVRPQDCTRMIAIVALNPEGCDVAWDFIRKNWKLFVKKFGGTRDLAHLIEPFGISTSLKRAAEIETFIKKNPAPSAERAVRQTLEHIHSNAAWLKRDRKAIATFLESGTK